MTNKENTNAFELNSDGPVKRKRTEFGTTFIGDAVTTNWIHIVQLKGSVFLTAAQVLEALHQLDIRYSIDGTRLKKANAVGDALGVKGLDLPVSSPPKRFYYLPAVEMAPEERDAYGS
ncbi:MAG: hypothetical protein JWO82_1235, partial [Akkermansiaceae bacterium]|nr:hypothetical protein [Akkermansiaceae bacterium]